jgi:hypothetical protein
MTIADEIEQVIEKSAAAFSAISDNDWHLKPSPEKWSKKEILGHLIDSAQNNLRRFIVTQYQPNDTIFYHQDEWVKSQAYQSADVLELQQLWVLINKQLVRTIRQIPTEKLQYTCNTGKSDVELHTLAFLIEDYLPHMVHHLKQIGV